LDNYTNISDKIDSEIEKLIKRLAGDIHPPLKRWVFCHNIYNLPRSPPDIESESQGWGLIGDNEWNPSEYNWRKVIRFGWKSNRAKITMLYKKNKYSDSEYKPYSTDTISIRNDINRVTIDNMKSKQTSTKTSEDIDVDYVKTRTLSLL
jgi:hypothetical protein